MSAAAADSSPARSARGQRQTPFVLEWHGASKIRSSSGVECSLGVLALVLVGSMLGRLVAQQPDWPWLAVNGAVTDPRQVRQLRQGVNDVLRSGDLLTRLSRIR